MNDLAPLVLLAVRLRSRGDSNAVVGTVDDLLGASSTHESVVSVLETSHADGAVRHRGEAGRLSLTPAGEAELAALLEADLTAAERADITIAYEAFLPVNRAFLAACVGWQDDPAALDELHHLVTALAPILAALTEVKARFASYRPRLEAALVEAATDPRWVDSPRFDSVHTVWFELHEHLLATLGRDRAAER